MKTKKERNGVSEVKEEKRVTCLVEALAETRVSYLPNVLYAQPLTHTLESSCLANDNV